MNLNEYQEAIARFVVYPKLREVSYLAAGLRSEAGEVCGVIAKKVRGDVFDVGAALVKEAGDCLWFVARMLSRRGVYLASMKPMTTVTPRDTGELLADLYYHAGRAADALMNNDPTHTWDEPIRRMLGELEQLTGLTVDELAEHNYAKLLDRQARGVLQGNGDAR